MGRCGHYAGLMCALCAGGYEGNTGVVGGHRGEALLI